MKGTSKLLENYIKVVRKETIVRNWNKKLKKLIDGFSG